jgi:tetratricopeptide (TPR) repeat protein
MHARRSAIAADPKTRWFDTAIEWLLVGLLAFMPFAFGAVDPWSEQVVVTIAAAISTLFLLKLALCKENRIVRSWAYVPVGLFVLLAVIQITPLPSGLVGLLSPNTVEIRRDLLEDLPNAGKTLNWVTLSFYPNATRHDLRMLLAAACVFVVAANTHTTAGQIRRLLAAITLIGGAVATIALCQHLLGNGKIYWTIPSPTTRAISGPFVNHSHYGQFMNLSIGAAMGLLFCELHRAFCGRAITPTGVLAYLSSTKATSVWLAGAMIAVGAATVFLSLTRGGMLSMLIAAGVTTLALGRRRATHQSTAHSGQPMVTDRQAGCDAIRAGRGWIMAIMVMGAFACVLYVGFEAVYDRLATLSNVHKLDGRWQILEDVFAAWTQFPLLGTGLGTHEVAFPMFDSSTIPALAAYAENEYAQIAEETGLVGLTLAAAFGILILRAYVRVLRNPLVLRSSTPATAKNESTPIDSAAYGLGFGLVAVMIHSLTDFGQHIPANMLLSAIFCGLLVGLSNTAKAEVQPTKSCSPVRCLPHLRSALPICSFGIWAWVLVTANDARIAEAHWKDAIVYEQQLSQSNWQGADEEYARLIGNAATAVARQTGNVQYRYWLNVYRWRAISRAGDTVPQPQTIVAGFVERIVRDLEQARLLCPTYGPLYCLAGQLERCILGQSRGAKHIRMAFKLAPCDAQVCFAAAALDADLGRLEPSLEKFKRALRLDGTLFPDAADIWLYRLHRPETALELAADNIERLSYLSRVLGDDKQHQTLADNARRRMTQLLEQQCEQDNAPAWALASLGDIYRSRNNYQAAIEYYRRALAMDYGQVRLRLNMAELLTEMNRLGEAMEEAKVCLRLRPDFKAAERLLANLSARATGSPDRSGVP